MRRISCARRTVRRTSAVDGFDKIIAQSDRWVLTPQAGCTFSSAVVRFSTRDEGLKICWVYISSALYERTEIAKFQAAYDVKRPLDRMPRDERQAALSKVAFEIEQLVG